MSSNSTPIMLVEIIKVLKYVIVYAIHTSGRFGGVADSGMDYVDYRIDCQQTGITSEPCRIKFKKHGKRSNAPGNRSRICLILSNAF